MYLQIEGIEHSKTKARSPQTNGICERFHRTIQEGFYAIAFRKKLYSSIEEMQTDLNQWMYNYNYERTHSGKHCYGKTPMQTFNDSKYLASEKRIDELLQKDYNFEKLGQTETGSAGEQPARDSLTSENNKSFFVKKLLLYKTLEYFFVNEKGLSRNSGPFLIRTL